MAGFGTLAPGMDPEEELVRQQYELPLPEPISMGPDIHTDPSVMTLGVGGGRVPSGEVGLTGAPSERQRLPLDVFHGTRHYFEEFRHTPAENYPTVDQALGPHFARDPAISNSFVEDPSSIGGYREGGHVIPARIPAESEMLRVPQTKYENGATQSDGLAIASLANLEAMKQRPTMLQSWLTVQHAMPWSDAERASGDLLAGRSVPIREGGKADTLLGHLNNYGGSGIGTTEEIANMARKAWQDQGYKGLIYENTAPMEIANAKDRTSYVVFDPKDVRSRFAKNDPAFINSRNLMSGIAGLGFLGLAAGGGSRPAEAASAQQGKQKPQYDSWYDALAGRAKPVPPTLPGPTTPASEGVPVTVGIRG